jgi:hypothetical protein
MLLAGRFWLEILFDRAACQMQAAVAIAPASRCAFIDGAVTIECHRSQLRESCHRPLIHARNRMPFSLPGDCWAGSWAILHCTFSFGVLSSSLDLDESEQALVSQKLLLGYGPSPPIQLAPCPVD